ncbi:MAG: CRISPR-associated protein Cas4 [Acidobacteria bacterium]|nr:CRISPR-associated protein Cas4 [Acidobacteriota bacterium]
MEPELYLPISALNQYTYCPRRCFLIHVEGIFEENLYTLEGRLLHDRADSGTASTRNGVTEHRHVYLISHTYRLSGIADLIEEVAGVFRPIEYKRGRRGKWDNDEIQLCAQALCLEEMLGIEPIAEGAIFYAQTARRQVVHLTEELRRETISTIEAIHQLIASQQDPGAIHSPRCEGCSMYQHCLPVETPQLKQLQLGEQLLK